MIEKRIRYALLCFVFICIGWGCSSKEEGCLDYRASNFDFDADKACADCCTYPSLYVDLNHFWQDTALFYSYPLNQAGGDDYFFITKAAVYLSEVHLHTPTDSVLMLDTMLVDYFNDGQWNSDWIEDNFQWFERTNFNANKIGDVLLTDSLVGISYRIGIPENYRILDTMILNGGGSLRIQPDGSNYNEDLGLVDGVLGFNRDTIQGLDTLQFQWTGSNYNYIDFVNPGPPLVGLDLYMQLRIQYDECFLGVDIKNDDISTMSATFEQNIRSASYVDSIWYQ